MAFKLVERLSDLSREFSSSFLLRALVHPGEASGQLLFDGVVWRFESRPSSCCDLTRADAGSAREIKTMLCHGIRTSTYGSDGAEKWQKASNENEPAPRSNSH